MWMVILMKLSLKEPLLATIIAGKIKMKDGKILGEPDGTFNF